ncbi:MAG: MerR family transcriptional regulator [Trueperaceae bacterium]|nr:MerR family transcriptional regulator [Trueperaceae bacterium]
MVLSIGDLAARSRESVKTLRYWTDRGLLDAERGENNYRYYRPDMVERVVFIRSAQTLGFTLADIDGILTLRGEGVAPCEHVRADLRRQLAGVRERIAKLRGLELELDERLRWALAHPDPDCDTEGCVYLVSDMP